MKLEIPNGKDPQIRCPYCDRKWNESRLRTYNPTLEIVCEDCLQGLLEQEYNCEIGILRTKGKK